MLASQALVPHYLSGNWSGAPNSHMRRTLAARGLEEHENHQFYVIYCITLAHELYFKEFLIHDSLQFTNPLGLCYFLLNT